jgi:hypothetical protein
VPAVDDVCSAELEDDVLPEVEDDVPLEGESCDLVVEEYGGMIRLLLCADDDLVLHVLLDDPVELVLELYGGTVGLLLTVDIAVV